MGFLRRTEGLTLIELTVVLSVLTMLTLVLVPAIANYITDSRKAAAQSEVATIAGAIQAFFADTGFFPQTLDTRNGRPGTQFLDLLVSKGNIPGLPAGPVLTRQGVAVQVDVSGWVTGLYDLLDNHLLRNRPGYLNKGGPNEFGWNGPYLAAPDIPADPWGNRYMVNVLFLDASPGALTATGQVKFTVLVVSAGPNGVIETPFAQPKTQVQSYGDDITFAIQ